MQEITMPAASKIVVVDDHPPTLEATSRILRSAGYAVFEAATGLAGLTLIRANKPDLILLDVILPDIDGLELCRLIKSDPELSDIFVVTLSSIKTGSEEQAVGLEQGAEGYIARPVSNRELLARVDAMLRLKQTTQRLKESEARFRGLVSNSPDTIYTLDLVTKQPTFLNRDTFCGYGVAELKKPGLLLEAVHPEDRAAVIEHWRWLTAQGPDGGISSIEYRLKRKHGSWEWIQSREIILERNAAGSPAQLLVTLTIITERKQAEARQARLAAELERSNKALNQFAYIASHDLQEPLRMVTSYLKLLDSRYHNQLDADAHEFIGYAVDGAERMGRLINDLLKYSRLNTQAKPFKPVDCATIVAQVLNNLKMAIEDSRAIITFDQLPTVMADDVQLTQLFQNLIANALKFQGEAAPQIHISAQPDQHAWQFAVRDNGIGFDPSQADRIFDIFMRLYGRDEYPGTGMGLAICKKIVEQHNGRIWAESEPGQGSTFYFTLPHENL